MPNGSDERPRHYTYNPETGVITNEGNGKSVKAEKFMDFEAWLLKIGAFRIEKIEAEQERG